MLDEFKSVQQWSQSFFLTSSLLYLYISYHIRLVYVRIILLVCETALRLHRQDHKTMPHSSLTSGPYASGLISDLIQCICPPTTASTSNPLHNLTASTRLWYS